MGNLRTALFNYLFAHHHKGKLIVRVEDTDKERSEKRWEEDMLSNLTWLGLTWDEGPYRQSERTKIYKASLEKLLNEGKAYWCFCSSEQLAQEREEQEKRGEAPRYAGTCRSLSKKEAQEKLKNGVPGVIRFLNPGRKISFEDLVRGTIEFDTSLSGDFVIAKDSENPLYNFTVVVDDHDMKITHVIRGEDHIPNTPRQILMQEALGFESPQYAHLPLLLGEDRTKLSKRQGDMSVTRFRQEGYLPESILNFLALLGWNPGGEQEVFSLKELVEKFSLDRVQKGGAVFDAKRLEWLSGHYIRETPLEELTKLALPYLEKSGVPIESLDSKKLQSIVQLFQERLKALGELPELAGFFFKTELEYETDLLKWKDMSSQKASESLERASNVLNGIVEPWSPESLEKALLETAGEDKGGLLWPLRVALSGRKASPPPFDIASILGKNEAIRRIRHAQHLLTS